MAKTIKNISYSVLGEEIDIIFYIQKFMDDLWIVKVMHTSEHTIPMLINMQVPFKNEDDAVQFSSDLIDFLEENTY